MTTTLTPTQLFDLYMIDDAEYAPSPSDLADALTIFDDLPTMIDSYISDMRDDEPITDDSDDNLYDIITAADDATYNALIELIAAHYQTILDNAPAI
jgi:hypothetical protein